MTTDPVGPTTLAARLAEALHKSLVGCTNDCFDGYGYRTHGSWRTDTAERILAAVPDLVAAWELGAAWQRAERALPEGVVHTLHLIRSPAHADLWQAVGGYQGRYSFSGEGPTPTAALTALAERLEALGGKS